MADASAAPPAPDDVSPPPSSTDEIHVPVLELDEACLAENLQRVQFTAARPKFIVWNHKSSYDIPEEEPTAALTAAQVERALQVFHAAAATVQVPYSAADAAATYEHKQHDPPAGNDEEPAEDGAHGDGGAAPTRAVQVVYRHQLVELLTQYGGLLSPHIVQVCSWPPTEATLVRRTRLNTLLPPTHIHTDAP